MRRALKVILPNAQKPLIEWITPKYSCIGIAFVWTNLNAGFSDEEITTRAAVNVAGLGGIFNSTCV